MPDTASNPTKAAPAGDPREQTLRWGLVCRWITREGLGSKEGKAELGREGGRCVRQSQQRTQLPLWGAGTWADLPEMSQVEVRSQDLHPCEISQWMKLLH